MSIEILENAYLKVEVNSAGAELCRIFSKAGQREILWDIDKKHWNRISPLLFPIIGKVKGDKLKIQNKTYILEKHGFVRDAEFSLVERTKCKLIFLFKSNNVTKEIYPYEFELYVTYTVDNNEVICTWNIRNCNDGMMYFSIGGHPALNLPHASDDELHDFKLVLNGREDIIEYSLNPPLVSGKTNIKNPGCLVMDSSLFKNDTLIYSGIEGINLLNKVQDIDVLVSFKGFPYVAIWSPTHENGTKLAPFVCIEPWYGIADFENASGNIQEKEGIQKLEGYESFHAEYCIIINR